MEVKLTWDDEKNAREEWPKFEAGLRTEILKAKAGRIWELAACDAFAGNPPAALPNLAAVIPANQHERRRQEYQDRIREGKKYDEALEKLEGFLEQSFALLIGAFSPECAAYRDLSGWLMEPMPAINVPANGWRADHRWRYIWDLFKARYYPAQEVSARYLREQMEALTDDGISFSTWCGKFNSLNERLTTALGHAEDDALLRGLISRNVKNPHLQEMKNHLFWLAAMPQHITIEQFFQNARNLISMCPEKDSGGAGKHQVGGAATEGSPNICIRCGRHGHRLITDGQRCQQPSCVMCDTNIGHFHDATKCDKKSLTVEWGRPSGGAGGRGGGRGSGGRGDGGRGDRGGGRGGGGGRFGGRGRGSGGGARKDRSKDLRDDPTKPFLGKKQSTALRAELLKMVKEVSQAAITPADGTRRQAGGRN